MHDLQVLIDEYCELELEGQEIDWEVLRDRLADEFDWTEEGAATVVSLTRDYGSFMLRNAAALALACNHEDGEFGY